MKCEHCDGTGEIETDNNGPIGACPLCKGTGSIEQCKVADAGGWRCTKIEGHAGNHFSKYRGEVVPNEQKSRAAESGPVD